MTMNFLYFCCLFGLTSYVSGQFSNIMPENRTTCPENSETTYPVRINTTARLEALRNQMLTATGGPFDAYIILISDEHGTSGSSYDQRLQYISGFSGSYGYAIVTSLKAALWTDGRYYLQADLEMDCNWILMKEEEINYPSGEQWLSSVLSSHSVVSAFANYIPISRWQSFENELSKRNISMVAAANNDLVDIIWTTNRPQRPSNQVFVHDIAFAGKSWEDKLFDVRNKMTEKSAEVLVLTDLDEIAWLYNLRGSDRTYSLFYAYSLIYNDNRAILYLTNSTIRLTKEMTTHLNLRPDGVTCLVSSKPCVEIHEYGNIVSDISNLGSIVDTIWVTPSSNYHIFKAAAERILLEKSPVALMKSIKNTVERERFTECILRDSAALVEFMALLEPDVKDGAVWTEISAADKLFDIRRSYDYNQGISFSTISAVGDHAAIIHYRPSVTTDKQITTTEIYLLDSGGQYFDGTTDVTRTFHFGTPTDDEKEAYTRVLMGMIDLSLTIFPEGLYGRDIDGRARAALWQNGWDYNHGTGHGIGYYLSVHEGPARINIGYNPSHEPIYEGMFFSDEPGYYEDGKFGVRLETLVTVRKAKTAHQFQGRTFLELYPVTLVPFEPNLIKYELLNYQQVNWLNEYNRRCLEDTGSYLLQQRSNTKAFEWLKSRTKPIVDQSTSAATYTQLALITSISPYLVTKLVI